MKTKQPTQWIIYDPPGATPNMKCKMLGIMFSVGADGKPIPVEVPMQIAATLLSLKDRSCRCHFRPPKSLFKQYVL